MPKRAHKIKAVAERLDLSERMAKNLVYSGELGSIKIGRCRRVTDEQIAEFLSRRQAASNAA
jgi:excisionase family DNA binding protein